MTGTYKSLATEGIHESVAEQLLLAEPGRAVLLALRMLLDRDAYLLEIDANERSITHRLAMYLQAVLPQDLHVDCEYNRDGIDPKRIGSFGQRSSDEDTDAQTVFPDIIAHVRGCLKRNYLAIEVKKDTSRRGSDVDFLKLEAYKRELNYQFALFVEFRTGLRPGVVDIAWIGEP